MFSRFLSAYRMPLRLFELQRNQHRSHRELEKIQNQRLRRIVAHAYNHVPYYHDLYKKKGIRPDDIESIADMTKLPTISKADFLRNWDNLISDTVKPEDCGVFATSGTTGTPLRILKDRISMNVDAAMIHYTFAECGMRFRDRFLEMTITFPHLKKCTFRHGPLGLMKGFYLMVLNDPDENAGEIVKTDPTVVYSFPTALECMIEDFPDKLTKVKPRLVFTQGEKLTEKQRTLIEECWRTTPNETYGSREFPRIAFECNEHQGLHVISDWTILELMKEEENVGPDEEGETVITSLHNFAMPFIRYRLGDLAKWAKDECSCGRNWPLLSSIEGRLMNFITLPSGRRALGTVVGAYIKEPFVKRYQMVYRQSKANLLIKIVCYDNISDKEKLLLSQRVARDIKSAFPDEDINVEVKLVSSIPPQPSGKNPDLIVET